MDKVYEAIERIPEQFRYVVIMAVSVVVALLYWILMRMPQQDELVRQEAVYQQVHRDLTEKKKIADNLQFWQLEVQRLKGQLDEALSRLPTSVEVDELLINLPNIAKKNGLLVEAFALDKERAMKGYAEVPMKIKLTGTYQGVGGFAQEVGDQARIMAVRSVKLKAQAGDKARSSDPVKDALGVEVDPGTELAIEAEVLTYRFLDTPAPPANGQKKRRP